MNLDNTALMLTGSYSVSTWTVGLHALEPGGAQLAGHRLAHSGIGEMTVPHLQDMCHAFGIAGMPEQGTPGGAVNGHPPARPDDTKHLAQRLRHIIQVLEDLAGHRDIEYRIAIRQAVGVPKSKATFSSPAARRRALSTELSPESTPLTSPFAPITWAISHT